MSNIREVLDYSDMGFGRQPGLYDTGDRRGGDLWADMEMIRRGDSRWDQGINEQNQYVGSGGDEYMDTVRYLPKPGSFLETLNTKHPGAIVSGHSGLGTDNFADHSINWNVLPKTPFGSARRAIPVNNVMQNRVINPNYVQNNENYGKITDVMNYRSPNAWVGPALMAALSMGMGKAIGFPALALKGIKGISSLAGKGSVNPLQLAMMVLPFLKR